MPTTTDPNVLSVPPARVLVIDDEPQIHRFLGPALDAAGFTPLRADSGQEGLRGIALWSPDAVVLDLGLPDMDGKEVLRRAREFYDGPIIILSARDREAEKIEALDLGANDYVEKPFGVGELLARIRAVLRRQANELPGAPSQEEAVIAFGKFKLNLGTREMFREDEPMPLTSGEFAVLKALVSHPREPLSRDKLMNLARGREYSAMERSIDVQISRLRRMVEEDPAHPRYIQTVWGLGYVFVPDGSKA